MNPPPALVALVEAGRKRRILTRTQAERLSGYAGTKDVASLPALRSWLASADGLHPDLARKLLALLPPEAQGPLGAYQPLAHLADGGMGSVWLAAMPDTAELVVVKTIKPAPGTSLSETQACEATRRFEREARITRQLTHPNVVRCLDSGVTDGQVLFLVLEYVDSGDLRDLVDTKGGLTEPLALAILFQVADGLAEAHRLKLVHRDIKPPNIFVASNGLAKLADFGIARSTESTRTMLTMEGAIVGSPMYMSPEQILTDPTLDIRSDIYALGAVLYFCLAAEAPYQGKLQEILHQHCTAPIPDVRSVRPKVSEAAQVIISRAMAKDRGKRYQTPEDLRDAIGEALRALGLKPGGQTDESTALRDFSEGTAKAVARDIATLTADLRRQAGLDEMPTLADPALQAGRDQSTITADLNVVTGDRTIAADLSGLPTAAVDIHEMATMTAVLLAAEPSGPDVPPVAVSDPGTQATVVADDFGTVARLLYGKPAAPPAAPQAFPLVGDLSTALAVPWIVLMPAGGNPTGDQPVVFLYGQQSVRLGKLREAPVDLCLRNYPVAIHKDACQRISRSHCAVRYDALGNQCLIEDLQAPNGTRLDGIPVAAGSTAALAPGVDNILELAGVVVLWLRCLARSGPQLPAVPGFAPGAVGLDTACGFDALTLTRPENRPEMAYAVVLRRLTIGGPGAELPLAGARTRTACEVGIVGGRWVWRVAAAAGTPAVAWRPLTEGTDLECGGRLLRAVPGRHELFG
jgi:serine/threonine protein kinase